jgi:hypothetical protein
LPGCPHEQQKKHRSRGEYPNIAGAHKG